jgi:hypothetical protein
MLRPLVAAAALALSAAAFAQTTVSPGVAAPAASAGLTQTTISPATQQVELLAPQLVPFSGSSGNFDSLVTGLTSGAPVTLATVGADGSLQIVTFTPGTTLSVLDAARLLEAARQSLIVRGVVTPSGQQLAASLMGGTIATLSGSSEIAGVLTGSTAPPSPVQVRFATVPPQSGTGASNLSVAQLQAVRNALTSGTAVTLTTGTGSGTTGTRPGTAQNVNFAPLGVRLSQVDADQAVQLAASLLAQQGILNPTAEQLRIALFGGTLLTAGGSLPLQGVLQGRVQNTSDSRDLSISASPLVSTSASPSVSTSASPGTSTSASPTSPSVGGTSSAGAPIAPRGTTTGVVRPGAR